MSEFQAGNEPVQSVVIWRHTLFNRQAGLTGVAAAEVVRKGLRRDDYDNWPLLDEGVRQVELLRQELAGLAIDVCLCSPTLRTRQTADIVLGERRVEVEYMEELRERDRGIFAYMPDEWSDRHPLYRIGKESFRRWRPGDESVHPRAETIEEVIVRIDPAVLHRADTLAPGGSVAISTHGETMAAFRGVLRLGARNDTRYAMPVIPNHSHIKPPAKASWVGQVQIDMYERRANGPDMTHFRTLGYYKGERFDTDWVEITRD